MTSSAPTRFASGAICETRKSAPRKFMTFRFPRSAFSPIAFATAHRATFFYNRASYRREVVTHFSGNIPSLETLEVPKDELYVALAEESGAEVWMTATYDGRVWPQVYSFSSPWNGMVQGWIPGHDPDVMKTALGPTFATVAKAWLG